MTAEEVVEGTLEHYGVKGMRWGQRNASPTPVTTVQKINAGPRAKTKVKAKGGQASEASPDAVKAAAQKQKLKKSGTAALSNQELRELRDRLQLEEQTKQLAQPKAKRAVKKVLKVQGQQQVGNLASEGARAARKKATG